MICDACGSTEEARRVRITVDCGYLTISGWSTSFTFCKSCYGKVTPDSLVALLRKDSVK